MSASSADPTKPRSPLSSWIKLVGGAAAAYYRDRGDLIASTLAFHVVLACAPLALLPVAIAGLAGTDGRFQRELLGFVEAGLGPRGTTAAQAWLLEASRAGAAASIVGLLLAAYASSRLAAQLRIGLNHVWHVDPHARRSLRSTLRAQKQRKLSASLLVVAAGPILLAVLVSRALLSGTEHGSATSPAPLFWMQLAQLLLSHSLTTVLGALTFRFVPDAETPWHAIWCGAAVTSVLFNVGTSLVGFYLANVPFGWTYGVASSVSVLLMWIYFSAQVFVFGAALTRGLGREELHMRSDGPRASRTGTLPSATSASTGDRLH